MSIWTRIAETLTQLGGSVANYLSSLANSKPTPPEKTVAFTIGMIALGAKMAKADGRVTHNEVNAFKQVFHVPPENLKQVARLFDLAKQDVAGFETYAKQMGKLFGQHSPVLEDVLDGLFHIAKADDMLHHKELDFLAEVASLFGFSASEFEVTKARHVVPARDDAFAVLGVKPTDSTDVIRARYRALVRDNHPDRHIAAGMPEEMVELATERLAQINSAYDKIMKQRGA